MTCLLAPARTQSWPVCRVAAMAGSWIESGIFLERQVAANAGVVSSYVPSMAAPAHMETFRFKEFELDVPAYELRRQGRSIKLNRQSMDLLILLVENRRQLVSRHDIVDRLWGRDVFVDVDTGINTAISKIRQALRDPTDNPSFVETVPGKGYRFI